MPIALLSFGLAVACENWLVLFMFKVANAIIYCQAELNGYQKYHARYKGYLSI